MAGKKRILIVEDETAIARALELKLTSSGYEAVIATDGDDALKKLEDGSYSTILLDLVMPKKDGFAVLEELKKRKIKTPVICLTNLSQEEDLKRAKELGAIDYLVKSDTPIADVVAKLEGQA